MFEQIEKFDQAVFLKLNGLHTDWLDPVMWWISTAILWIPLFAFILWYAYKKGNWRIVLVLLGGAALCILLSDRISVELFKNVFQRYRPTHNLDFGEMVHTVIKPNGEEYRGGLYSFVSSHATNYTAVGTFIFLHLRQFSKHWTWLFLWVALICYSRIYLGVHYPGDLIAGGMLGLLIGFSIYKVSLRFKPLKNENR